MRKVLAIISLGVLLLTQAGSSLGQEVGTIPTPPAEPTAAPVPETPTLEEAQEAATPTPTPTPTPTLEPAELAEPTLTPTPTPSPTALPTAAALANSASATESGSVVNTLEQSTVTGQNSASANVGEASLTTGEANTAGTVITAANTNIEGVTVEEFNLTDDQKGDLVLDFKDADQVSQSEEDFQNNEAVLENNLNLSSDTGNNEASLNTQGDSTIQTGDANVSATVLSFLNNELEGEVVVGVVNIFGSLTGDIILPEEALSAETRKLSESEEVTQTNSADIENNLSLTATTGDNETSRNTGGNSLIETGDAQAEAEIVNVANNNLDGGSWWLAIINVAGEWIGKILASPEGGSPAESQETTQTNSAKIVNNLTLTANTGKNQANDNTGGDSVIKTGEAKVMASLVNFVNNNVTYGTKVVITIVNVFGTWLGDFLPPGAKKNPPPPPPPPEDSPASNPPGNSQPPTEPEIITAEVPLGISPTPTGSPIGRRVSLSLKKNEVVAPGEVMAVEEEVAPRQIRINLAWLVLAIPIFLLTALLKKLLF